MIDSTDMSSEFVKVNNYMRDNMNNNQLGGFDDSSDIDDSDTISSSDDSGSTPIGILISDGKVSVENSGTNSSENGVRPFSSTDTSEYSFRHPYNKSRF